MQFKTSISKTINNEHFVRGHNLVQLINKHSFAETMMLLLRGDLPTKNEAKFLEKLLIASSENGVEAPSLYSPRISVASGNSFHVALAAGILAIGEHHGGAGEACAEILASLKNPKEIVSENKIIPGFGHKIYKNSDPRTTALYAEAKKMKLSCKFFNKAYAIEKELENSKGKKLPLNIDGALAAGILELKLDPRLGKAIFIMARIVGMSAHVLEELNQKNSYRRLEEGDVEN